ncbi:F-box protein interaction domain protein [Medicago truncatula]|uniref:F-box protein interaction domain protein n=1 Tax=Medicago truncatula TaxID=3880 RepID=G7KD31_MEDTR|nr:F-box protein interaction domain protein [Medicago truncatula]
MALPDGINIRYCNTIFSQSHSHLFPYMETMIEETEVVATTRKKVRKYISDDITSCILSKLPLKSSKRFKCVCKPWSLLFQNSYFIIMYRNNLTSTSSNNHYDDTYLVLHGEPTDEYHIPCEFYLLSGERFKNKVKIDWPPPFQENDRHIYILGSVNINGIFVSKEKLMCVLPSRIPWYVLQGFGYDCATNDYKVVQFVDYLPLVEDNIVEDDSYINDRSSYETFWEIYSLRSNCWRKLDVCIPNCYLYTFKRGIGLYTNGVCHWCARTDDSDNFEECLVSFDFSNEVLITTPTPSYLDVSPRCVEYKAKRLVLLNESIALISTYLETYTFYISILGELDVRESWTNVFTVEHIPFIEYPIGVGKNCNIVFFQKTDGKLAWVDLSTKMIEEDLGVKAWRFGSHFSYRKVQKKLSSNRRNE